jgi:DNA mismatch repair protein MutL
MSKIRVLPDILAHKIAAGEIVERPASVVKELVENSLDASSTSVTVLVEAGGKKSITVRDNGTGMSAEDASLAFQHHATSKISSFEDLSQIATLGFRGEALPSISSVSRLRLRTVQSSGDSQDRAGTEIEFERGKLVGQREIAWPKGTEIRVSDLFFNVPARRKFLRTVTTEIGHISRQITHYALAHPEVEFKLLHQNNPLLEVPPVESLQDRIFQLMGEQFLENLVPVEYERDGIEVVGFTSLPHEQRSSARAQYLFVNRRVVRDKVMTHAIRLAYRDLIPSSSHPVVLLFVNLNPERVDVNVHPSKIEVRFTESDAVHSAIYHGIEEALARSRVDFSSLARDLPSSQIQTGEDRLQSVASSINRFFQRNPDSSFGFPELRRSSGVYPAREISTSFPQSAESILQNDSADPHRHQIPETAYLSPLPVILGQFVESFIVATDREGVMVIDQHVAHERILYDQALKRMSSEDGASTQRLLMPITLDLTAEQATVLESILEQLNLNGFEVEWFGDRTIAVKGVPEAAAKIDDVHQLLEQILDDLGDAFRKAPGDRVQRLREKLAISLSCRAAIKINTPLSEDKMQWLIDALFRCENPYTCPHGRPIVLRLNLEDVLRGFKRI